LQRWKSGASKIEDFNAIMFNVFVPLYELWQSKGNGFFFLSSHTSWILQIQGSGDFRWEINDWLDSEVHMHAETIFFFIVFPSPWHFVQTLVEEVTCWSFYLPDSFKALMSGKYSWEINDWYLLFIIKFIMWPWCKISMYIMNNHVMVRYIFLIIIIINW
jgi:hypothetical protein